MNHHAAAKFVEGARTQAVNVVALLTNAIGYLDDKVAHKLTPEDQTLRDTAQRWQANAQALAENLGKLRVDLNAAHEATLAAAQAERDARRAARRDTTSPPAPRRIGKRSA